MKQLKDLKSDILDNKFNNFYVFYGEDWGLRKHYIKAIAANYKRIVVIDDYEKLSENKGSSLIQTKTLFILYNCDSICNLSLEQLKGFIKKIGTDCVILDFDIGKEKSNLFKDFSEYITYFPLVSDRIGLEFVNSEISIIQKNAKNVSYNCFNDYSKILLETDKIRSYALEQGISQEHAYEILLAKKQLNERFDLYDNDLISNDLLTYNSANFSRWDRLISDVYPLEFWYNLIRTTNDFIIAYYVTSRGKYNGGKVAYESGLPWGRIKIIRELPLCFDSESYLLFANELAKLDIKVKTGKLKPEDLYSYFIYTIM